MNTNPTMDAASNQPKDHPHSNLNEVRFEAPRTFPALWDLSEMLSGPTPPQNGHSERKSGSNLPVTPEELSPADVKPEKVISELPEWDFLGFVFKPY